MDGFDDGDRQEGLCWQTNTNFNACLEASKLSSLGQLTGKRNHG